MDHNIPPEPPKPTPEHFGLSAEQVARFSRNNADFGWWHWLIIPVIYIVFTSVLKLDFILAIPYSLGVGFVIVMSLMGAWAKRPPSGPSAFKAYQGALASYQKLLAEREAALRKQQEEKLRTQEAWWRGLSGRSFEIETKRLLEKYGYQVRHTGSSGDGGVDLIISGKGAQILVQCKQHAAPVSPGTVRDLFGALHASSASSAWLISASGFTTGARGFAKGKPIVMINLRQLLDGNIPMP